jgi:hypothetical protein
MVRSYPAVTGFTPDPAQREIIEAAAEARLVVDAGPGTGKTATAAARVLALLEGGMAPEQLWMVSFARAAVLEMRQRLAAFNGGTLAVLPRVTTLDSLAWRLRSNEFEDDDAVLEGHDAAIAETLALMRLPGSIVTAQLRGIRHVLLDETQDFVGSRAQLVAEMVARLPASCGVTILTDEAQAIYGFSGGASLQSLEGDTVAQHLLAASGFKLHTLTSIHRTDRAQLLRLFADTRRAVMRETGNPARKLERVRRTVGRKAARPPWRRAMDVDADTLVLYRSRAEVLDEASRRAMSGQPFRLRLSGLPVILHHWIALALGEFDAQYLSRHRFLDLWRDRVDGDEATAETAWDALCEAASSEERIEMKRLLALLRSSSPPLALCRFDPGDARGPVIGTIHASKGREMPKVRLMMPQATIGRDDPEAEARVLFVGATRAKVALELGVGIKLATRRLASGRVYVTAETGRCRCEIGRPGDFDWIAGYRQTPGLEDLLRSLRHGEALQLVFANGRLSIHYGETLLGLGSPSLMEDLRELRNRVSRQTDYRPFGIKGGPAWLLDVRTQALDPASLARTDRKSALYLAPVVIGLVDLEFYAL